MASTLRLRRHLLLITVEVLAELLNARAGKYAKHGTLVVVEFCDKSANELLYEIKG